MADDEKTPETPTPVVDAGTPAPSAETYRRVVAAKQGLETQVESLRAEVASLSEKAATVDTVASQMSEWKAKAEAAEGKFSRWQGIASRLGTTETEAIETAEFAYSRLPEADRPELHAWLDGIKADPKLAPKSLTPWMQAAPEAPATPKASPTPPKRGAQAPGAPSSVSPEAFRAAREEGMRTGDWTTFRELKAAAGYATRKA